MKKLTALGIILFLGIHLSFGQCIVSYSFAGSSDTLTFTNLSSVSNAHFYWNFGDGTGDTDMNPIHVFPDDGKYLVTLYGLDTVSNCVNTYESWISVSKPDTIPCNLNLSDTIQPCSTSECLITTNLSTNCSGLNIDCDAGPGENGAWNVWLGGGWINALFVDRIQAYTYDTIYGMRIIKEYYKTAPFHYTSNTNYENCSANFEIKIDHQVTGAQVTFTAMNKNATSYEWEIIGFGNPIYQTTPVYSHFYPYLSYLKNARWLVVLRVNDLVNNCGDTISQQILVSDPNFTFPTGITDFSIPDLNIYPNPATDHLIIESDSFDSDFKFEIYNMLGELISSGNIGESQITIDISKFIKGSYILKVVSLNNSIYRRFIKQ